MHAADRTYRNTTLRLTDLAVVTDTIADATFENCVLVGPAVILLLGDTTFGNNVFDTPSLDAVFWDVPAERQSIIGAVALVNCTVVGCRLQRIGMAVPANNREQIYRSFGLDP